MMVPIVLALFVFASVNAFVSDLRPREQKSPTDLGLWVFGLIMVGTAVFRNPEMPDYNIYATYAKGNVYDYYRLEPTFRVVLDVMRNLKLDLLWTFLLYACIAVATKLTTIRKLSPFIWGSVVVYLGNFFILHDLIQMRAGVATGIALWSTQYAKERRFWPFAIGVTLATLFHYSTIVYAVAWFVGSKKNQKWIYLSLIPISYGLAVCGFTFGNLLKSINLGFVQVYMMHYDNNKHAVDLFSMQQIVIALIGICLAIFSDQISKKWPLMTVLYKLFILGIVTFTLFSDIATMAFRLSQVLWVTEILLVPAFVLLFNEKRRVIGRVIPVMYGLFVFLLHTLVNKYLF